MCKTIHCCTNFIYFTLPTNCNLLLSPPVISLHISMSFFICHSPYKHYQNNPRWEWSNKNSLFTKAKPWNYPILEYFVFLLYLKLHKYTLLTILLNKGYVWWPFENCCNVYIYCWSPTLFKSWGGVGTSYFQVYKLLVIGIVSNTFPTIIAVCPHAANPGYGILPHGYMNFEVSVYVVITT